MSTLRKFYRKPTSKNLLKTLGYFFIALEEGDITLEQYHYIAEEIFHRLPKYVRKGGK